MSMRKPTEKERLYEIVEAIKKVADGDYSVQIRLSGNNDDIDSLADGLNKLITERKRMQTELSEKTTELEAVIQAKSKSLAGISHDLRTPLNVIIGFTELMLDEVPGEINEAQRQCLNDILNGSRNLLNMVNRIFDPTQVEPDKSLTDSPGEQC